MFSSEELIASKSPLALLWQCAYKPNLSRSESVSTDLSALLDSLLNPSKPLSLRLSAQLLLGAVRLSGRQAHFLLQDCDNALLKVRISSSGPNFKLGVVAALRSKKPRKRKFRNEDFKNLLEKPLVYNDQSRSIEISNLSSELSNENSMTFSARRKAKIARRMTELSEISKGVRSEDFRDEMSSVIGRLTGTGSGFGTADVTNSFRDDEPFDIGELAEDIQPLELNFDQEIEAAKPEIELISRNIEPKKKSKKSVKRKRKDTEKRPKWKTDIIEKKASSSNEIRNKWRKKFNETQAPKTQNFFMENGVLLEEYEYGYDDDPTDYELAGSDGEESIASQNDVYQRFLLLQKGNEEESEIGRKSSMLPLNRETDVRLSTVSKSDTLGLDFSSPGERPSMGESLGLQNDDEMDFGYDEFSSKYEELEEVSEEVKHRSNEELEKVFLEDPGSFLDVTKRSSRSHKAEMFHTLLRLKTENKIEVEQDEPYGDINFAAL
eukprot:augustus_masked-scaffold_47-processed-gene-1.18-mRNA-1 protein AED:1.00 eAED:1.00 QI:0/-1/0/0/-1/1/1/0/492